MNRKDFLKALLGVLVVPKALEAVKPTAPSMTRAQWKMATHSIHYGRPTTELLKQYRPQVEAAFAPTKPVDYGWVAGDGREVYFKNSFEKKSQT